MAANEAEVDLIVSAAGALPDLERQLSQIVRTAENGAPEVDVQASLAVQNSIAVMSTQLDQVLRSVDASDPSVDVEAALDAQASLRNLRQDLDELTRRAATGATDILELEAVLDFPRSLAEVTEAINDLVADVEAVAPDIDLEVDVDTDDVPRAERVLRALGRTSITTAKGLGTLTTGVAQLSLVVGGGASTVATLVTALQQVAPAAAVGTSAMLTQKLAAGTLKLAMIGVEDAIKGAFDPELTADEFHKSIQGLAPEARKFVDEIHTMRRELKAIQQEVQNRVFKDFDEVLRGLGRRVLPTVVTSVDKAADSLNRMGRNVATAAMQLADQGVLGQALKGANQGLVNLEQVPARVARSFGFLAAASAPAFNRITLAIDELSLKVATKLQRAFESGELEKAIDKSVSLLSQLGRVIGNFASGIGNIFGGLTQNGRGLFDILESLSEAFDNLTASREFQSILNELALTADVLVQNILPLVQEAFVQLAPVIQELAPVVRDFVAAIGPELIPIIQQLGPILIDIALILKEQLPLAIDLASAAIDALSVVLNIVAGAMDIAREGSEAFADLLESDFARAMGAASKYAVDNSEQIQGAFARWTAEAGGMVLRFQTTLADFSANARDSLVSGFVSAFADVLGNVQSFVGIMAASFAAIPGRLYDAGVQAMSGLANGLLAGVSRVIGIARDIANTVASTVRDALDIASPSRVMKRLGKHTVDGFVEGIASGQKDVEEAFRRMLRPATAPTPFVLTPGLIGLTGNEPKFTLPKSGQTTPVFNVYVGNELLGQYVAEQFRTLSTRRDRVLSQGVRL
jgi:malate synthase